MADRGISLFVEVVRRCGDFPLGGIRNRDLKNVAQSRQGKRTRDEGSDNQEAESDVFQILPFFFSAKYILPCLHLFSPQVYISFAVIGNLS